MAARASKWQRQKNPAPIVLQPRDREVLVALHDYRILTREQIERLFNFQCSRRANYRLRQLFDNGYASRSPQPTVRGSAKAIYYVGPQGVLVVASELGLDPNAVKRQRKATGELRELFMVHALELNDVRIAFSQAIEKQPEMSLETWISDLNCAQEYRTSGLGKNAVRRFRPDGYFRFFYQNKLYSFFLEHDRSTMTSARFVKKVQTYLEFSHLGFYRQRFGVKFFRVLVIVPTRQRLLNLKQAVEAVTDKFFWFTTLEQIAPQTVFLPIWQRAGQSGLFPLIPL